MTLPTAAADAIITSPNHGLVAGQTVTIAGVAGTTQANSTSTTPSWTIGTQVLNANQFSLNGTAGSTWTAYTYGGSWATNNEESILMTFDGFLGLTFPFKKTHPAGVSLLGRGNPGPWTLPSKRYDPRNPSETAVVPFFMIID